LVLDRGKLLTSGSSHFNPGGEELHTNSTYQRSTFVFLYSSTCFDQTYWQSSGRKIQVRKEKKRRGLLLIIY